MDKLVRQEIIEVVIVHGRWTFDWCTQDKQLLFLGNKHMYLSVDTKTCLRIYIYIYVCVCVLKEREREIDQLTQFDIFFYLIVIVGVKERKTDVCKTLASFTMYLIAPIK